MLAKLVDAPFDISNEGFPRMGAAELTICGGVPARLFRVSFSGEMAYEIAVPARYGDAAIRALMQAGAEFDITPYGTEALNVLRIEKGHVGGAEINGQTTARDLGLGGMVTADKDCIGKVLAGRPALLDPERPIVVGVKPRRSSRSRSPRARISFRLAPSAVAANDEGYLTSVAFSPVLGHDIGIGFLARGRDRIGERIRAVDLLRGHDVECVIASPVFVRPGRRAHPWLRSASKRARPSPDCSSQDAMASITGPRRRWRSSERTGLTLSCHLGASGQGERGCSEGPSDHRA